MYTPALEGQAFGQLGRGAHVLAPLAGSRGGAAEAREPSGSWKLELLKGHRWGSDSI